jgi:hypothetical protein
LKKYKHQKQNYKVRNTFAKPKSASLTDPLACTNIFAHLMSLKLERYNYIILIQEFHWYRKAEKMIKTSRGLIQRKIPIKFPKTENPNFIVIIQRLNLTVIWYWCIFFPSLIIGKFTFRAQSNQKLKKLICLPQILDFILVSRDKKRNGNGNH